MCGGNSVIFVTFLSSFRHFTLVTLRPTATRREPRAKVVVFSKKHICKANEWGIVLVPSH
jgi:hypothetical protein